jgi:hypothetical protein
MRIVSAAGSTGNLCDLSRKYFATTFLSSSLTCPAMQSGLCRPCQVCTAAPAKSARVGYAPERCCLR